LLYNYYYTIVFKVLSLKAVPYILEKYDHFEQKSPKHTHIYIYIYNK